MKEFDKCIILLFLATLFILFARLAYGDRPKVYTGFSVWDFYVPELPRGSTEETEIEPVFCFSHAFYEEMQTAVDDMLVTYTTIEYEYLGTYYITAYCPWECGYNGENFPRGWTTASGTICHRSDWEHRYSEPTTCAVDPRLHSIWGDELLYIEEFDRVFVAEDTGGDIKNYWIDLFYEDMEDVYSFPTGYYTVYRVTEINEYTILGTDENIARYIE